MVKSKKFKRLLTGLMAVVTVAPMALALGAGVASAAKADDPVTINVHKYMYKDGTVQYDSNGEVTKNGAYFENDGNVQTPQGTNADKLTPYDPGEVITLPNEETTTLGNVTFTLVDITAYANGKKDEDILATLKTSGKYDPSKYATFITDNGVNAVTQDITTKGQPAKFTNVATTENGEGKTYMILETAVGPYVTQRTIPMIVHLPFTTGGSSYLDDIHLYGKNQITEGVLDFTKYSEKLDGTVLENAVFNLYKGEAPTGEVFLTDGTWGTPAEDNPIKQFKTDVTGKLTPSITGLQVGKYYLVEQGFDVGGEIKDQDEAGNLKSPNAQNDAENKLGFEINAGDTGSKVIKFVNFKKPTVTKDVENEEDGEKKTDFSVGDTINYSSKIYVPTDINGGTILPDGTISKAYKTFTFKDTAVAGLTSNVASLSDVKFYDNTNTEITDFVDPDDLSFDLVEDAQHRVTGFTVDFVSSGKIKNYANQEIYIKYSMTINSDAVIDTGQVNTADLDFSNGPVTSKETETETVYTGGHRWHKTGEETEDKDGLNGAEFVVINNRNGDANKGKYMTVGNDGKIGWVDEIEKATKILSKNVNGVDGIIEVKGLEYGDYKLKETFAPDPYQLPINPIDFEVTEDSWTTTTTLAPGIVNKTKPDLPITGGMGTLIFTVLGLTVMAGAAIYTLKNRKTTV